jgi:acetoin utilization deacetylase AcuC-like enzyme
MQVVYAPSHAGHVPQSYAVDGNWKAAPEVPARVDAILEALRAAGGHTFGTPTVDPLAAIRATHDGKMLDYLRTVFDFWKSEFPGIDLLPDTFVPRHHGHATLPARLPSQAGYWCFDMAAPITAGTWQAALASAGCAVTAADMVLRSHGNSRVAYALCRPPGHHAGRDYFGGFCYLNNVAIAAHYLLARSVAGKLAILDVDYHHGNGTQDIFYENPLVLTASLHADPNTMYPYFWGHADERGRDAGAGTAFNVPLPRGSNSDVWFEALEACLHKIRDFSPSMLLVSLGVDTHESDPISDFKLGLGDFGHIGRMIAGLKLPTVFVQEGGYNLEHLGSCVARVLGGFTG